MELEGLKLEWWRSTFPKIAYEAAVAGEIRIHRLLVSNGLDRLRGDSQNGGDVLMNELLSLVEDEVGKTAWNYQVARFRGQSLARLPPYVVSIGWSAPRPDLPILYTYIRLLSKLCNVWIQHKIPRHRVRVSHVLIHHGTLEGNTFPLVNIGDHTGYRGYHRLSEKGCFSNVLCSLDRIRALGNILAVCGLRVSGLKRVRGGTEYTIATQAPFYLGWFLDRCKNLFHDVILVPIIIDNIKNVHYCYSLALICISFYSMSSL